MCGGVMLWLGIKHRRAFSIIHPLKTLESEYVNVYTSSWFDGCQYVCGRGTKGLIVNILLGFPNVLFDSWMIKYLG